VEIRRFCLGFFSWLYKNIKTWNVVDDVKNNICVYKPGNRNSIMQNTTMTVYFLARCFIKIFEDFNKIID
jgi:hypothetical protein